MKIRYEITEVSYEVVYEVVKVTGFGCMESPNEYYSTGLIYKDETDANEMAKKLLFENTTPEQRKESWRELNYEVKERKLL